MLILGKYLFRLFSHLSFYKTDTKKFGTHYGGWILPVHLLSQIRVVLSAGAGEDISFEVDLIHQYPKLTIHIFDPTPLAIEHMKNFYAGNQSGKGTLINRGMQRHPSDHKEMRYQLLPENLSKSIIFHPLGWSKYPETIKFFLPKSENMVSLSSELKGEDFIECPCKPVSQIIRENPELVHAPLVIKMDIEGSEYGVIEDLNAHKILPAILLFEIHLFQLKNFVQLIKTIFLLLKNGYRCYCMEGDNYGFIHKSIQ